MSGLEDFRKGIRFGVGDGRKVRFWRDVWCGDRYFGTRFPVLFGLVNDKEVAVGDYMVLDRETWGIFWDVRLRRQLKDEEVCLLVELLGELSELRGLGEGDDGPVWFETGNCEF